MILSLLPRPTRGCQDRSVTRARRVVKGPRSRNSERTHDDGRQEVNTSLVLWVFPTPTGYQRERVSGPDLGNMSRRRTSRFFPSDLLLPIQSGEGPESCPIPTPYNHRGCDPGRVEEGGYKEVGRDSQHVSWDLTPQVGKDPSKVPGCVGRGAWGTSALLSS